MYSIKRTPLAAALLLALNSPIYSPVASATPASTNPPVAGAEFPVNTHTLLNQKSPSIAMDATGDYVVVWQSKGQDDTADPTGYGIYAQRFHADGSKAGGEFLVNTYTTGNQINPGVAMDDTGDFVVVWEDTSQNSSGYDVYARRYNADGSAASGEFKVNANATGHTAANSNTYGQSTPKVAMDASGDFVVAWTAYNPPGGAFDDIVARTYNAQGNAASSEFLVNSFISFNQLNPSVAMDASGAFVISWSSNNENGAGSFYDIDAQRYDVNGDPVGVELQVNTYMTDYQDASSVAMDATGDFVIAWKSEGQEDHTNEPLNYGIYARRYNAAGSPVTANEFLVNTTYTTGNQLNPGVAMDTAGDFVITWTSNAQDGNLYGVYAKSYNANSVANGNEFQVNTNTTSNQSTSVVSMDTAGDFVVAWQSYGQDGGGYGIYGQRYAAVSGDLNLVVNSDTNPVSAGNNFTYTLITTNKSTGYAVDVSLSEPLPTNLTYVSDDTTTAGWTCAPSVTTLSCNKPFMAAGEVSTINVIVKANTAGTLTNTVTVASAQTDTNPADNTDTVTTTVNAAATSSGGSLGVFTLLFAIPLWLRRRWLR